MNLYTASKQRDSAWVVVTVQLEPCLSDPRENQNRPIRAQKTATRSVNHLNSQMVCLADNREPDSDPRQIMWVFLANISPNMRIPAIESSLKCTHAYQSLQVSFSIERGFWVRLLCLGGSKTKSEHRPTSPSLLPKVVSIGCKSPTGPRRLAQKTRQWLSKSLVLCLALS